MLHVGVGCDLRGIDDNGIDEGAGNLGVLIQLDDAALVDLVLFVSELVLVVFARIVGVRVQIVLGVEHQTHQQMRFQEIEVFCVVALTQTNQPHRIKDLEGLYLAHAIRLQEPLYGKVSRTLEKLAPVHINKIGFVLCGLSYAPGKAFVERLE